MVCRSTSVVHVDDVLRVIRPKMLMGNALLFVNAILMAVLVGIGAYAPRYRRHPVIGVLFLGATTMFLPVVSSVAGSVGSTGLLMRTILNNANSGVHCSEYGHLFVIFLWAGLVVVIGINASEVVACDAREGRRLAPPKVLTATAVWTAYLTISTLSGLHGDDALVHFLEQSSKGNAVIGALFLIMFAKLLLQYYAFYKGKRSFALGKNPRVIAGYMAHLQDEGNNNTPTATDQQEEIDDGHVAVPIPPALVVMGEDNVKVEKQPHGYGFKQMPAGKCDRLVTLDSVWKTSHDDLDFLQSSVSQPKDLCFSFSLFKLLRCRFAKYLIPGASFTKAQKFFRDTLLQGAGAGYQRVFTVVAEELSFIHDYYYSALPIYYSHHLLSIFSVILSLCTIVYCLFLMIVFIDKWEHGVPHSQLACSYTKGTCSGSFEDDDYSYFFNPYSQYFGGKYSDVVATYLVAGVLVLAETKVILFYMSSNWTKVTLIYHYVLNRDSWVRSPIIKICIGLVFKYCSSKLAVNIWNDKMKQCSILDLHPWKIPLLGRHLHLRARAKKVKVPTAVKATIFQALKETCGGSSLRLVVGPPSFPTCCKGAPGFISGGKSPAYTILAWHIATTIFEESHQPQPSDDPDECRHRISATHLSRYCAYLVGYCPELLPDDDEWCKSLYDDVKKDAARLLSGEQGAASCDQLIELLRGSSNHGVLRDGASLGNQLVSSNTGWEPLARFWSNMILYVAPSDNLEAHAEAIYRGGELITLLWELLYQAGIDNTALVSIAPGLPTPLMLVSN